MQGLIAIYYCKTFCLHYTSRNVGTWYFITDFKILFLVHKTHILQ